MIKLVIADGQLVMREAMRLAATDEVDIEVVGVAEDGFTAISMFEQLMPDVTIIDLQLQNALRAIATIHSLSADTTIVALTMYPNDSRVATALALGATFQMLKTATSIDILTAVRDAVTARKSS
jgi:DNA-binding NarL/FixJ family response regulator